MVYRELSSAPRYAKRSRRYAETGNSRMNLVVVDNTPRVNASAFEKDGHKPLNVAGDEARFARQLPESIEQNLNPRTRSEVSFSDNPGDLIYDMAFLGELLSLLPIAPLESELKRTVAAK